jgi:hypothetical protein
LGQGTVQFNTRLTLGTPPYYTQVFFQDINMLQRTGNTANNLPAGTQVYTSFALTGSGWTAQLFAIPGNTLPSGPFTPYGVPITDTFVAAFPTTTFRTGTSAGSVALTTATLPNIAPDDASAVLQMRVFSTSMGSWAAAVAAFNSGQAVGLGASPPFVVNNIGGINNNPPQLTGVSFSILYGPEPSSLTLFSLGLGWLVVRRGIVRQ